MVAAGGINIDRCDSCGSMWFDALELDRVLATREGIKSIDLAATGGHSAPAPSAARLKCPVDHSDLIDMSDIRQAHVKTHGCTVCGGVLLDPGELRDLTAFSLKERLAYLVHRIRH